MDLIFEATLGDRLDRPPLIPNAQPDRKFELSFSLGATHTAPSTDRRDRPVTVPYHFLESRPSFAFRPRDYRPPKSLSVFGFSITSSVQATPR